MVVYTHVLIFTVYSKMDSAIVWNLGIKKKYTTTRRKKQRKIESTRFK